MREMRGRYLSLEGIPRVRARAGRERKRESKVVEKVKKKLENTVSLTLREERM